MSASPATAPRRRGRPRKSSQAGLPSARDRLLEAAAEVFAEHGFEYATLDQVARRAGFAQSAIYNHFGGKPELLLEVVKSTFGALRVIRGAPEARLHSPSLLCDLVDRLLSPENVTLRALTIEAHLAARHHPEVFRLLDQYHRESAALIRELISSWQADGSVPAATDADRAAQMFLTLALGLCNMETVSPEYLGDGAWLAMVHGQVGALLGVPISGGRRRRLRTSTATIPRSGGRETLRTASARR
jgi:AcrR family transcriptional regulator